MGKKYKHLKDQICSWDNILLAYEKTARGKRYSRSFLEFQEYDLVNLRQIQEHLISETYTLDPFHHFKVFEPKERNITALSFRDRVVQHAFNNILEPIFDSTFLDNSYACRKGKGTHAGVKYVQSVLRKHPEKEYFLKTDYSKFFPSISHNILFELIKKKISCKFVLKYLKIWFPENGYGIPVGWLLSQLFANVYGNCIDNYIKHTLKIEHFARYMDDIVIIHDDKEYIKKVKLKIENFSIAHLELRLSKWHIQNVNNGINFLGYRIWTSYKKIRRDSVVRAKRKIKKLTGDRKQRFLRSWQGHIRWANCYNLSKTLLASN